MYDQKLDPVDDPALVEVLTGRIQLGQTFDEIVSEGHTGLVKMTQEQLDSLRDLVEKRASRSKR